MIRSVVLHCQKFSAAGATASGVLNLGQSTPYRTSRDVLTFPYEVVDTDAKLQHTVATLAQSKYFSIDIEAFVTAADDPLQRLGEISLVQVCSHVEPTVFLIDVITLGKARVVDHIKPVLHDKTIQKLFFDCRRDVEALSCQMGILPACVLDLQLWFAGVQWRTRSIHRRSGMAYVLKNVANICRLESDAAVQLAMTRGNRAVWDVRPLPSHFLEYAAGDVRHALLLGDILREQQSQYLDAALRLTAAYVEHYGTSGKAVVEEADPTASEVKVEWLERYFGPGGVCSFCRAKGHIEAECFKKQSGTVKCKHCGEAGHMEKSCYKKFPQLLKCSSCGQIGHTGDRCFKKNPCTHCGGAHLSHSCHKKRLQVAYRVQYDKKVSAMSGDDASDRTDREDPK